MKYLAGSLFCFVSMAAMAATPGTEKKAISTTSEQTQECGTLTPRTLAYVCDRCPTAAGTANCFGAGKAAYVNECALGVCDRYQTEMGTIECVQAIRNSDFDIAALQACDRIQTEKETTRCLINIGYPHGPSTIPVDEIRADVRSARDDVLDGYYESAERTLTRLLRKLN